MYIYMLIARTIERGKCTENVVIVRDYIFIATIWKVNKCMFTLQ